MNKKLVLVIAIVTIMALWMTPAFAAQGQITEVNPSGINTVVILQADEGDEEAFRPGQPGDTNRNAAAGPNGTTGPFATNCPTQDGCEPTG